MYLQSWMKNQQKYSIKIEVRTAVPWRRIASFMSIRRKEKFWSMVLKWGLYDMHLLIQSKSEFTMIWKPILVSCQRWKSYIEGKISSIDGRKINFCRCFLFLNELLWFSLKCTFPRCFLGSFVQNCMAFVWQPGVSRTAIYSVRGGKISGLMSWKFDFWRI